MPRSEKKEASGFIALSELILLTEEAYGFQVAKGGSSSSLKLLRRATRKFRETVRQGLISDQIRAFFMFEGETFSILPTTWNLDAFWQNALSGPPLSVLFEMEDGTVAYVTPLIHLGTFYRIFETTLSDAHAEALKEAGLAEPQKKAPATEAPNQAEGAPPPYLAFMISVFRGLRDECDLDLCETPVNREHLARWILKRWPPGLGVPSERKAQGMATFLTQPEHEKGGQIGRTPLPELAELDPDFKNVRPISQKEPLPPYLQLMLDCFRLHPERDRVTLNIWEHRLEGLWAKTKGLPAEPSKSKLKLMATFLRDPKHEKGGNLPPNR